MSAWALHVPLRPVSLPDEGEVMEARVRTVLQTRPGQVPWRPDFGCDLAGLIGQPTSARTLDELRWRVEASLRRWVPEVRVTGCSARVVLAPEVQTGAGGVPRMESALLQLGVQAAVEIDVQLAWSTKQHTVRTRIGA